MVYGRHMAVRALLDAVGTWNIFDLLDPPPHVAKRLAEITEAERAELIEALPPAARACATDGKLSDMPNFMPRGNPYNRTGCEAFQLPGWLVGKLGLPDGLPVFRELFAGDPNLDVRLAAGHFALMYPGTAAEIADGAVARASGSAGSGCGSGPSSPSRVARRSSRSPIGSRPPRRPTSCLACRPRWTRRGTRRSTTRGGVTWR